MGVFRHYKKLSNDHFVPLSMGKELEAGRAIVVPDFLGVKTLVTTPLGISAFAKKSYAQEFAPFGRREAEKRARRESVERLFYGVSKGELARQGRGLAETPFELKTREKIVDVLSPILEKTIEFGKRVTEKGYKTKSGIKEISEQSQRQAYEPPQQSELTATHFMPDKRGKLKKVADWLVGNIEIGIGKAIESVGARPAEAAKSFTTSLLTFELGGALIKGLPFAKLGMTGGVAAKVVKNPIVQFVAVPSAFTAVSTTERLIKGDVAKGEKIYDVAVQEAVLPFALQTGVYGIKKGYVEVVKARAVFSETRTVEVGVPLRRSVPLRSLPQNFFRKNFILVLPEHLITIFRAPFQMVYVHTNLVCIMFHFQARHFQFLRRAKLTLTWKG